MLNPLAKERDEEQELPPLVQVVPDEEMDLPPAPSGKRLKRKIEGSIALPEPVAEDVQRYDSTQMLEDETPFPTLGGEGYLSNVLLG